VKAIRVNRNGGPEVLEATDIDAPSPGPGEVAVALAAAGVNFVDVYHRRGMYPIALPFTPGQEGAGIVTAVGDDVAGLAVGDRIAWATTLGSYAEVQVVPASAVVVVPDGIDLDVAAAAMLQGLTAHYLTRSTYPLEAGDRCLIHAGAGGVGLLVIQMAKRIGAEVFTTVSSDEKAELAAAAGADHVIRYDRDEFGAAVEAIAGPNALAAVYDGVGAATFSRGLDLLARRGTMVLFGQASGAVPPFDPSTLAAKGSLYVTRPTLVHYVADSAALRARASELFAWIEAGDLDVRIGGMWPLEAAADAHRALEARATTGKTLLRVGTSGD
jgi:NADPH:quinone reductase